MSSTKDKRHMPPKWKFDEEVTSVFNDMLRRSIPQYDVMRKAVVDMVVREEYTGTVIDLGCSRGDMIAALTRRLPKTTFYGFDVSEPMVKAAQKRFRRNERVVIENRDIAKNPPRYGGVYLSILTMQFIPMEYRQRLVKTIAEHIRGYDTCLIMVEKVLGNDCVINDMMVSIYEQMKKENGYTQEEIDRKKLQLEGVLVPMTAKWNEEMLRMGGFTHVDCFWRWMNFAGWIAKI